MRLTTKAAEMHQTSREFNQIWATKTRVVLLPLLLVVVVCPSK